MLDKVTIDKMGQLLVRLQNEFNLPTYELVAIVERTFPGRPWKRILQRTNEENAKLLREIFGEQEDANVEGKETG